MTNRNHWDNVYETKQSNEVSWTQEKPSASLQLIANCDLPKTAKIIDVGGGDSNLVDYLLELGYNDLTVLDISEKAIEKAKLRLGKSAANVKWIVSDITEFQPMEVYDIWHDRAAFHFLTEDSQIEKYKSLVQNYVSEYLIMIAFSTNGPLKCSGLEIKQYSITDLEYRFQNGFEKIEGFYEDHETPFKTIQNFVFSRFIKQ
nr:class I SAM-dependent methyltransferase [uncultured Flavobacterium sp.]